MPAERTQSERLFIAVPLTEIARSELARLLPELPGRRVLPDKWHFTIRFLGGTAPVVRDRLIATLDDEPLGDSFGIRLAGLGAFPRPPRARVVWIGVERGAEELIELARAVSSACTRAGVAADARPYSPHLTLSRLDPPQDVRRVIQSGTDIAVDTAAAEVLLLRSWLGHGPPRYETLARYALSVAG